MGQKAELQNIYQMYIDNGCKFGFYVRRNSWSPDKYAELIIGKGYTHRAKRFLFKSPQQKIRVDAEGYSERVAAARGKGYGISADVGSCG